MAIMSAIGPLSFYTQEIDRITMMKRKYRKFSIKSALPIRAHPPFQISEDKLERFPTVYNMPILSKYMLVIYRWKALELYFSNKSTPMCCFRVVRLYWRIYSI